MMDILSRVTAVGCGDIANRIKREAAAIIRGSIGAVRELTAPYTLPGVAKALNDPRASVFRVDRGRARLLPSRNHALGPRRSR